MPSSIVDRTDSYKISHWKGYPNGMDYLYTYSEARGGLYDQVVFFGLQYYLKKYLSGKVFTRADVDRAVNRYRNHFGRDDVFNYQGWFDLFDEYQGYLPLSIKAVPEGSVVPTGNVLMTVEATDAKFAWLVTWVESLLMKVWYPTTVATQSAHIHNDIAKAISRTGGNFDTLPFKCHDFGYRGASSEESAAIGGAAHLTVFKGTDNIPAMILLEDFYGATETGFSIPATEHSIISAFGPGAESLAFQHWLEQFPTGMIACVSDTYDIVHACRDLWGKEFKDQVLERDGVLVIRPDSGNPGFTTRQCLDVLAEAFGYTTNDQGFKTINPKVRLIWGDGMDRKSIPALYQDLAMYKWSADNLAVGSGGGLLQKVNRDDTSFATKASEIGVNGNTYAINKSPTTDRKKRSKLGRMKLIQDGHSVRTVTNIENPTSYAKGEDLLQLVYFDGCLTNTQTLDEVRARVLS